MSKPLPLRDLSPEELEQLRAEGLELQAELYELLRGVEVWQGHYPSPRT